MSYFDSRVGECPVWQVVLIMVVKVEVSLDQVVLIMVVKVEVSLDMVAFVVCTNRSVWY